MDASVLTLILIAASVIPSIIGFQNKEFTDKYLFHVEPIMIGKEYIRLLTSAFLHANPGHLFFNMLTLYFFAGMVEMKMGPIWFLAIYFIALFAGNALALLIHRNHPDYRALGASGAVSGILFASIMLEPGWTLLLFFVIPMPAWLFAIGYTLYSLNGIRKQNDNLGHEAHLGGALAGVLAVLLFNPEIVVERWWLVAAILVPIGIFFYLYSTNPLFRLGIKDSREKKVKRPPSPFVSTNKKFSSPQEEIDYLLDKASKKGAENMSMREKDRLKYLIELVNPPKKKRNQVLELDKAGVLQTVIRPHPDIN